MLGAFTEAGTGEHNLYWPSRRDAVSDGKPLTGGEHYLGIDAVRWYVNRQGNIFRDRMASGTVRATIAGEAYETALGTYELRAGERTAPIFNTAVVNNRLYRGGDVGIQTFVRVVQQDTLLGELLRSMARASVDVAGGAIATATATGPSAVLLGAGTSLVDGVRKILLDGKRPITILEPNGVSVRLQPGDLVGAENYLLVHRGARLDGARLQVVEVARGAYDVRYAGAPLEDGAWVLFRLRRESRYGSPRPWQDEARRVRAALDALIERWERQGLTVDQVREQVAPRGSEPPSVADQVLAVAALIRSDFVLTEGEASVEATRLATVLKAAQDAAQQDDPAVYRKAREELTARQGPIAAAGRGAPRDLLRTLTAEANRIAELRSALAGEDIARPSVDGLVELFIEAESDHP